MEQSNKWQRRKKLCRTISFSRTPIVSGRINLSFLLLFSRIEMYRAHKTGKKKEATTGGLQNFPFAEKRELHCGLVRRLRAADGERRATISHIAVFNWLSGGRLERLLLASKSSVADGPVFKLAIFPRRGGALF